MKRLLSVALSLILLLALCPAAAAAEHDISQFELPAPKAPNCGQSLK